MIRIASIYVMSAALLGALAWSTVGAGAGTLNLHTSTPSVKVTTPKAKGATVTPTAQGATVVGKDPWASGAGHPTQGGPQPGPSSGQGPQHPTQGGPQPGPSSGQGPQAGGNLGSGKGHATKNATTVSSTSVVSPRDPQSGLPTGKR